MKTSQELEQAVLDIIKKIYCKEYLGKIKVTETKGSFGHLGYKLELACNKDERPFTVAGEGSATQFLELVEKELRLSGLDRVDYFTGYQIYNIDECEKKCRVCN